MIPDKKDMDLVLKYLVFKINTIDGKKGSSLPFHKEVMESKNRLETVRVKH